MNWFNSLWTHLPYLLNGQFRLRGSRMEKSRVSKKLTSPKTLSTFVNFKLWKTICISYKLHDWYSSSKYRAIIKTSQDILGMVQMEILDLMYFFIFLFDNLDLMYLFLICILNFKLFVPTININTYFLKQIPRPPLNRVPTSFIFFTIPLFF